MKHQATVAKRRLTVEILDFKPSSTGSMYREQVMDDLATILRPMALEVVSVKDIVLLNEDEPEGEPDSKPAEEAPEADPEQPEEVIPPETLDFPIQTEFGFVPLSEITKIWPPDVGGEG